MTMTATPANLSNAAIAKYAEQIGDHHGAYDSEGRLDLEGLVARLGGHISYDGGRESLHVRGKRDFTIFLPEFTSGRRDRFTAAHELGHYFLHYLYPQERGEKSFGRGGRDRAETEASVFASSLLMPEEHFRRAHGAQEGDLWSLAAQFHVSPDAARVRAEVLRLGS